MADNIEPALTQGEWADPPDTYGLCVEWDGNESKIIAIANASLPDDSPYKITRADVGAIESTVDVLRREFGQDDEDAEAMEIVAAKLAALLPPEKP